MPDEYVDFLKATVTHPDGVIHKARVAWHAGTLAIWKDAGRGEATRVFFATDTTFTKRTTARQPHIFTLQSGAELKVIPNGGCACGSVLKHYTTAQLVDPDLTIP